MMRRPLRSWQQGVSSITAIFLVTVLAVLAAAGLQMWRSAQDDQTLDMQTMRARNAARAGLQVGFWRATPDNDTYCISPVPTVINLVLPGSLAPYRVTLTCTREGPYNDGGPLQIYRRSFTAVACNQLGACPDNLASQQNRYIEAVAVGECVSIGVAAGVQADCREIR